ncbi:MAG: TadG family pilus assembly protein [Vulcanimicrobiaceae bacterium]
MKERRALPLGRRRHSERGQLLPLLAAGVVVLLGMVALAVDVGFWRYQQRLEQAASDSGAVAGAIRLYYPTTTQSGSTAPVEVTAAARTAAGSDGFTDDGGVGNVSVTVNSPPQASATSYPSNTAVEVTVKRKQPVFFAGIFGNTNQFVSTRAVAAIKPNSSNCIYQLDPHGALQMVPPGYIGAVNCGIAVNGQIPTGTISAKSLSYSGPAPGASLIPPLIAQQSLTINDPCLTISGCAYLQRMTFPPASGAANASGMTTLNPGVYTNCCANITTLNPGVYYFYGGITSGTITGNGVTVVNVDGGVTFNGHNGMSITAPTTGPTAGIAFYQPPSNANPYTGNGKPGYFQGLFYAPTATYSTNGNGDTFGYLVVGGTNVTGNKPLTVDPTLSPGTVDLQAQATHVVLTE